VGRLALLLVVCGCLLAFPVGGRAIDVLPTPVVTLPPLPTGLTSPTPLPSFGPTVSPVPTALPSTAATPAAGGSVGGANSSGGGGDSAPSPAAPGLEPTPIAVKDSLIHTVLGPLPDSVPLFPVLLPLFAGLFLLFVSAALAAYRRTQEAHRFARLERTKSDFLKLASHELRTPLTVLLGYVSMIRDGDVKPDTPAFRKALPIIEDRLNQVNTIVEQMLDAARLEDGLERLQTEDFELGAVVADCVLAIRSRADGHQVDLRAAAGTLPVHLDRGRVGAIVDQLLDNAVKYSPAGGAIECTLMRRKARALLTVRDSGIGIASEDLERVFTRFGRLVTRDNSHIPGAGLGLYLARENARRMGGDITVTSRPAKGSAFTLSLPLNSDPAAGPAAARVQVGS
jgi:signal transduction histidine kinase